MMSKPKSSERGFAPFGVAVAILVILAMLVLFLFPTGEYVQAKVRVQGDNLELLSCGLFSSHVLEVYPPTDNATVGDKTLVLTVSSGENKIDEVVKENIGEGIKIINAWNVSRAEAGVPLHIVIALYRNDLLLHQVTTELTH